MRGMFATGALVLAGLWAWGSEAAACTCIDPDIAYSWRTNDHAFVGRARSVRRAGAYLLYDVVVVATAKSCVAPGTRVSVATPASSAACGAWMPLHKAMVIFGDTRWIAGRRAVFTSSCSGNLLTSDLTAEEEDFLLSRELSCDGAVTCADGTPPVSCFAQPCASSTCGEPGAVCEDNYCGGCNAEWYTPDDFMACTPW